jgi:hypothetical protein
LNNPIEARKEGKNLLGIIVPMTKLSGNYMNLESWLSEMPIGEIEVILVHDVQDFETAPIMNRMLTKINDDKIKYFERTLGAPGLTRNFGMTTINSEWMWFVDADDLPDIENVLQELKSTVPDVEVIIGQFQIDSSGDRVGINPSNKSDLRAIARDPGIWRMVFRTRVFMDYRFQEFRMAEDQLFLIDSNIFERKMKFSEKIFYTYFKHSKGQLTSQKSAISELEKTIPLVVARIQKSSHKTRTYLEIMLARQIATQLKHATNSEILINLGRNFSSTRKLKFWGQIRVGFELIRILTVKAVGGKNE